MAGDPLRCERRVRPWRCLAWAVLITSMLATHASAGVGVLTGEQMATLCNRVPDKGTCELWMQWYVRGMIDAMLLPEIMRRHPQLKEGEFDALRTCIDESGASMNQLRASFEKALREHPEEWQQAAPWVFLANVVLPLCEQALDRMKGSQPDAPE